MERCTDIRDDRGTLAELAGSSALTAELAACLERFLAGTADEGTMSRSRWALDAWRQMLLFA